MSALHRLPTTVHHLVPNSQAPRLFWEPSSLVAAYRRCNYGDKSGVRSCAVSRPEPIAEGIWAARAAFQHAPDASFVTYALHF
jgi:hypothetical protein